MSDHPAMNCLRDACTALSERNAGLRQWRVDLDGFVIRIELEWTNHSALLFVREPDSERSFGRTASFSFGIQMEESTELMSHELEVHLSQFIETVRKADPGSIPLPQAPPTWEPGAGPPSEEPESNEPKSDEPESDEPAVGLDVVSNPQPKVHHREAWISEAADRAHRDHQAELNWGIFCGLHTLNEHQYPFTTLLGTIPHGPLEEAYSYLVARLQDGFSATEFEQRFGRTLDSVVGDQLAKLVSFEALRKIEDRYESNIGHPARLKVYQSFLYSPEVHQALRDQFSDRFDPSHARMNELMNAL